MGICRRLTMLVAVAISTAPAGATHGRELSHAYNKTAMTLNASAAFTDEHHESMAASSLIVGGVALALCVISSLWASQHAGEVDHDSRVKAMCLCISIVSGISVFVCGGIYGTVTNILSEKKSLSIFCASIGELDMDRCKRAQQVHSLCGTNFTVPTQNADGTIAELLFDFRTSLYSEVEETSTEDYEILAFRIECRSMDESYGGTAVAKCQISRGTNTNQPDVSKSQERWMASNQCVRTCHAGSQTRGSTSSQALALPVSSIGGETSWATCDGRSSDSNRFAVLTCGANSLLEHADCCMDGHGCCQGRTSPTEARPITDQAALLTRILSFNASSVAPSLITHLNATNSIFSSLIATRRDTPATLAAVPTWPNARGASSSFAPCEAVSPLLSSRTSNLSSLPLATCASDGVWEAAFECTDTCQRPAGSFLINLAPECSAHSACANAGYEGICCGDRARDELGGEKCCCFTDLMDVGGFENGLRRLLFWGCAVVGAFGFVALFFGGREAANLLGSPTEIVTAALLSSDVQDVTKRWAANPIGLAVAAACCIQCPSDGRKGSIYFPSPLLFGFFIFVAVLTILAYLTAFLSILVLFEALCLVTVIFIFMHCLGYARTLGKTDNAVHPEPSAIVKKAKDARKHAKALARSASSLREAGATSLRILQGVATTLGIVFETLIGSVVRVLFDVLLLYSDLAIALPAFGINVPPLRIPFFIPDFFSILFNLQLPALPNLIPNLLFWLGGIFETLLSLKASMASNLVVQNDYVNDIFDIALLVFFFCVVLFLATPLQTETSFTGPLKGLDILARLQYWRRTDKLTRLDANDDGHVSARELFGACVVLLWGAVVRLLSSSIFILLQALALVSRSNIYSFLQRWSVEKHQRDAATVEASIDDTSRMKNLEGFGALVFTQLYLLLIVTSGVALWLAALAGAFHRTLAKDGSFLGIFLTSPLQLWPAINVITVGRWGNPAAKLGYTRYAVDERAEELVAARYSSGPPDPACAKFNRTAAKRAVKGATSKWISLLLQVPPMTVFFGKLSEYANEGELDVEVAMDHALDTALAVLRKLVGLLKFALVISGVFILEATSDAAAAGLAVLPASMGLAFVGALTEVFADYRKSDDAEEEDTDAEEQGAEEDGADVAVALADDAETEEVEEDGEEITSENLAATLAGLVKAADGKKLPPALRRRLIAIARPKLETKLQSGSLRKCRLAFETIAPVLELIDSPAKLEAAFEDPSILLDDIINIGGDAALGILIARAEEPLSKPLAKIGLEFEDVEPVLGLIDSMEKLQQAVTEPEAFLEELQQEGGAIGMRIALVNAKKALSMPLEKAGLDWEDVESAIEAIDSIEELQQAVADPDALFDKLEQVGGTAATKVAKKRLLARLKTLLEAGLKKLGRTWDDVDKALAAVEDVEALRSLLAEPDALLERLGNGEPLVPPAEDA